MLIVRKWIVRTERDWMMDWGSRISSSLEALRLGEQIPAVHQATGRQAQYTVVRLEVEETQRYQKSSRPEPGPYDALTDFTFRDFTGDGNPNLVTRKPDGTLWMFNGLGDGTFLQNGGTQIGVGW